MTTLLITLSIQFFLITIGYLITLLIGVKNKIEALGLSYLFGSGLITLVFLLNHFFLNLALDKFNLFTSIIISLLVLILLIYSSKKMPSLLCIPKIDNLKKKIKSLSSLEKIVLITLVGVIGYTFMENYVWPITSWDSLALYDFRARVIANRGNMLEGLELGYFFQYPPYTSFLHVFGYIVGTHRVKIVYSFIYLSLLIGFYSLLRRRQSRLLSLVGTLSLAVDRFILGHSILAYTNLSYVVFLSLGLLYLVFWLNKPKKQDLLIGTLLVAFSTWIRASDPFWYLIIFIFLFGIAKYKKFIVDSIFSLMLVLGVYKFWDTFVGNIKISTTGGSREQKYLEALSGGKVMIIGLIHQSTEIIFYFVRNMRITIGYLLPVALLSLFYDWKNKNKFNLYLFLFILLSLLIIIGGIVIFSLFYETWNQIDDSLQRLSMPLIPLIIFAIFNSSIWKENAFEKK